ncbi:pyruvate dehydrogenase complex dihydrolipoamide acetyltransferase [Rhodobacteraceae bacterium RKSG542]|uniref:pyruvate dehydrogenase complex dihydrolipoamide acetyltransferase n=1 Tax=Pseudovibrio flavus TaxID=2529854 RepID=UPI0012BC9DBA|nr:pyruvate dehydrogenase complex dihydrolipoamide acetyltransferase [Pseudovibrio flavus]MTI16004.1 pyruvate dehydrogenase complex dihydrolipoamide acetyltransferase [Pseudovibrio flavus]
MATEVILPKVDMDMETGKITQWFVKDGDTVSVGDVIFEIETDKAAMEVDSPASGIIRDIIGKEGEDTPIGVPVAWIFAEGEDYISQVGGASSASSSSDAAVPEVAEEAVPQSADNPVLDEPSGSVSVKGVRATPLARRMAREHGVDLASVTGSGPKGRIRKRDVLAALEAKPAAVTAEPASAEAAPVAPAARDMAAVDARTRSLFEPDSFEEVAHDNMRRTIAERLQESKQTVPHFYVSVEVELDALLALRKQMNAESDAFKISVNDMMIKAWALALRDVPDANVSWTQTHTLKHKHVDVGVAVSIPGGLITPIVRSAETKSLSVISAEMKDLAARAKERKLKPAEYNGGTTAISNMGMMGVSSFAAIVNPPHSTILAVAAAQERIVPKNGEASIVTMMTVTLSVDHRTVDGALCAEVLNAFKRYVERPMLMVI